MPQINSGELVVLQAQNSYLPDDGPKIVGLNLDFTVQDTYSLDALLPQQLTRFISMLQTVYIDMKDSTVALTLTVENTRQVIKAKPGTQGYYTVTAPNPIRLSFVCPGGPANLPIILINTAIPGSVWSTT